MFHYVPLSTAVCVDTPPYMYLGSMAKLHVLTLIKISNRAHASSNTMETGLHLLTKSEQEGDGKENKQTGR